MTMPDGARLSARVWMPKGADQSPAPAVLEYIPYRRRDFTRLRDEGIHPSLAEAGYVSVRVDSRGSGDSDGTILDEYSEQEIQDGVDIVAWLAKQPWCNGSVGMFGKSWGAFTSFQVASRNPPALRAIAPVMGTDDRWLEDVHYYGGVLNKDNLWWGALAQTLIARAPDPTIVGKDRWRDMWKERLDSMELWTANWLQHQTKDEMWEHGSVSADYASFDTPCYFFGGWHDLYRDTPFRIAQELSSPVKVLIGPWAHLYPHEATPGPQIDFIGEMVRWFDHWLKGVDTGLLDEPRLRYWLQDTVKPQSFTDYQPGRWVEEAAWPSPNIVTEELWINAGSVLSTAPETDGEMLSICSPSDYGKAGGDMASFALPGDRPADQRHDAGGALVLRTAPLEVDMDILGQPSASLVLTANRESAFVSLVFIDEDPDGTQTVLSRGFANLNHTEGPEQAVQIVPGREMEVEVPLSAVGQRIAAGHRLMLHVASTNWPLLWPSPEPVTLSLEPGRSRVSVPVRLTPMAETTPREFPAPPARPDPMAKLTVTRPGTLEREWSFDATADVSRYRMLLDGGVFGPVGDAILVDTGTEMGNSFEVLYEIGKDPLSARSVMTQTDFFRRGEWHPSSKARVEMSATATHFVLDAEFTCYDGAEVFFETEWHHEIERNGQ